MTTTDTRRGTISVYLLAAPEDRVVAEAIQEHLAPIVKSSETPITVSSDFDIEGGAVVEEQRQRLLDADIVLALISADFINDDDVYERNQRVMERHNQGGTVMIPILVRNCLWKLTPFGKDPLLPKLLPKNVQPLNNADYWNSPDDALTAVVTDIYDSVSDLSGRRPAQVQPTQQPLDAPSPRPAPTETVADRVAEVAPLTDAVHGWEPPSVAPPTAEAATSSATLATPATWQAPARAVEVDWRQQYYRRVLWKRAAAVVLDMLFGFLAPFIGMAIVLAAIDPDASSSSDSTDTAIGSIIILTALAIYYIVSPWMEASKHKATFGKRILKIQITDPQGGRISFWRAFVRNILRTLVFYSYLLVVPLIIQIITFRKSKQLFHDQISKTVIGEKLAT